MKKVLLGFFFALTGMISFAQTAHVASCTSISHLKEGVSSGNVELVLPQEITAELVAENAQYYVPFFTVSYNENNHLATFQMVANTSDARRVIIRFLSANQINTVLVEGKQYDKAAYGLKASC